MSFILHEAIETVTVPLAPLALCEARLMQDARFVWIVLVPRRADLVELDDLDAADRARLMEEAVIAGAAVRRIGQALGRPVDKLNTAALGNVTPQLHVHVIGRRRDDPAWPRPVWGIGEAVAWSAADVARIGETWRTR